MSFVCLIEIQLHFPDTGSLKGKRKELAPIKAQLQRRFGAAVAETDHHDLWQRSELTAALVGREAAEVGTEPRPSSAMSTLCFLRGQGWNAN